jgi:DNA (cytosine-5)-methyltransferase 1
MSRPLLLDLFCGAGGAAVGYHRAGFDVVGVDIKPQPHYPFKFHQDDAFRWMESIKRGLYEFDAIHASPPCQAYSPHLRHRARPSERLIEPTRALFKATGLPYVIENVKGAPLTGGMLCGSSFDLPIWRHRYFETAPAMMSPPCRHDLVPHPLNPYNTKSKRRDGITGVTDPKWKAAMGIDWMTGEEIAEAIPPAYTQFIGEQLLEHLARVA